MIKTYIKHFMIDKLLNNIFDNLYKIFDIIPPLIIGKTYRMVTFNTESCKMGGPPDNRIPVLYILTFIYSNTKVCNIEKNGVCTFCGGTRTLYQGDIYINCIDLGNEPFILINSLKDLVMVIE